MKKNITIHMIGNAHLDPVWLWHWQRGSDEALATCRAACDLLDDYPQATFTRGEAWVYEQVCKLDSALFRRIKKHIKNGRWEVTGGWWVQADTNIPVAESLSMTIEIGLRWFRENMGIKEIPVAYLVDSFGHGPYLPRIIKQAGQKYFVMMRPSDAEKELPSSLFRWRSPDGYEILTYRIVGAYLSADPDLSGKIKHILNKVPDGITHMMCFYGVGDHGGGPTRKMVEWIMAHKNFAPGVRLEFSTTTRFFEKVQKYAEKCPVVTGQLEPHAVGCYSVCGHLKRNMRAAELELIDCEKLIKRYSPSTKAKKYFQHLNTQWETICFNQFHDILPGSAIREAIDVANMQIGGVRDNVARITHDVLRGDSGISARCEIEGQRLHLVNRIDSEWEGIADCEIWMDWMAWNHHLEDEKGRKINCQIIPPSYLEFDEKGNPRCSPPRILFKIDIPSGKSISLKIAEGDSQPDSPCCTFSGDKLSNGKVEVCFNQWGISDIYHSARGRGWSVLETPLAFECYADQSDTWGHSVETLGGPSIGAIKFEKPLLVYEGGLRTMVCLNGIIGNSKARLFVWLNKDEEAVHMRLDISYAEPLSLLKAILAPHFGIKSRFDRVCGGWIEREGDGKEYALHHAVCFNSRLLGDMGLLLPDTFALDGTRVSIRPTLIRNNVNAYNQWTPYDWSGNQRMKEKFGSDEGPTSIRMSFVIGEKARRERMEKLLNCTMRPPYIWDDFRGKMARLKGFDS